MAVLTIRDALNQALREELLRDENVFIMGEEVAEYDGAYKVTRGLWKEFGDKRVVDTPITELGFAALGVGAAMAGLRPVIEFMTWNFSLLASDQIINHAAKMLYMSGGQFKVPIVFRGPNGSAYQVSSQHSQALEALYANFPGLKVVMPSTPADAKGLLKSAIRDDNPIVFLEQERMYGNKGEVPDDEDFLIPLGVADVKREGTDCTIVARSMTVPLALQAAERMETEYGVSVEVVDPRTIKPLDIDTIVNSIKKTNRLVITEESHAFASVGAEISYQVMNSAFDYLDAPIKRLSAAETPTPYARNLEILALPDVEKIIAAVKEVCYL
ncbi:MAG TPA: pyruvate dehydrogenase complex E1 component subunit beta [Pyrinomonadaceae bacterium]|nr:pyruvate dehydrogenase complex E1 component subunit beta [Chloracidobacterium sp.]MBP9936176.1 pyruvate dehydrogenase complex E1 component subunit beta [Pyrinomonadaceae bacterium]MBK7804484.1 pyruvate dehydrogenase complex E1 component subunit beta [Chloracidobacterium sp.]MBK9438885.1 pyruvate dehydrogenase complex E1 component subunit beta [Chloracidobacterium sp.]MBL0240416.1 pyruvate dehydrogenase complex E1 component subunit beta [Chloracidobacterium sp.]